MTFALFLAAALCQEAAVPKYPTPPAGFPPPFAVEGASADGPDSMQSYEEVIPGTTVRFRMVPIRAGKFRLGSPADEVGREEHEGPQVEVSIEPFWMEEHETRWDEFRIFQFALDRTLRAEHKSEAAPQDAWADAVSRPTPPYVPMDFGMGVEGYPAICMTQFAARQYTKWLSMKTGRFHRLPSEAEWEYACRAGSNTAYSFGAAAQLDEYAWHYGNSDEKYHLVKGKRPNAWGLFDMHGNVSEWCLDQLRADTYAGWLQAGATPGAIVWPTSLYPHVVRGGSWDDEPEMLRSAARRGSDKEWKVQDPQFPKSIWYFTDARFVGFRVVRPLNPPPPEQWAQYWDADVESVREIEQKQRQGERS